MTEHITISPRELFIVAMLANISGLIIGYCLAGYAA